MVQPSGQKWINKDQKMTDIVDRLKGYAEANEATGLYTEANCANDAIEEIERLRKVNKKLQQDYYDCMEKLEYIHSVGKDI